MMYYYNFWFTVNGIKDRFYRRKFKSIEVLTLDKVKQNNKKYTEVRKQLKQELCLDNDYKDVELFDVVRAGAWKSY